MSAVQPVAVYALRVPAGAMVPAVPNAAASFRVSMAAIDPDEEPEFEDGDSSKPARAILKIVRPPPGLDMCCDSDDEDYSDEEDYDEEEDSDDEEVNGGPSDKEKARKLKQAAAQKELEEAMEEDDEDDEEEEEGGFDLKAAISKLIKGKSPLTGDDDDEEDDESEEGLDLDENVICTLFADKNCQQPLDITVCEGEPVFFKNTGNQTVFLTGNYVIGIDEGREPYDEDEEDEDDYDLSPDEDELDMDELMAMNGDESDELDGMDDPRITEVDSEEEAPKLVEAKGKGKKRAAEEESLDDMMAKGAKGKATKEEPALTKAQQKKLKKNNGDAAPVEPKKEAKADKKEAKADKKVQFAKNLEQGPTPNGDKPTGTLGVKEVKGVTIDDKKLGKGVAAKSGNTVAMRYIGKLEDGKVFDSNKKGKPFSFKLGKGEVIKGWDIGIAGMAPGGERRITIPSHLAYGKKALPGIPANSKLIFDVKLLEIK
ncbi:FK506-binding protein 4 [Penicillium canariense]|uniref:FK506-binding protein n=1 Tax=Penicillium canariense TaxID=189055 RepID=A0A9W9I8Q8_9EURO|nr:FK506-binding protein 4 [Penicillium canariense]KAJ5168883.1 FK506-binding protein 4 [Penicillium canariense]